MDADVCRLVWYSLCKCAHTIMMSSVVCVCVCVLHCGGGGGGGGVCLMGWGWGWMLCSVCDSVCTPMCCFAL